MTIWFNRSGAGSHGWTDGTRWFHMPKCYGCDHANNKRIRYFTKHTDRGCSIRRYYCDQHAPEGAYHVEWHYADEQPSD